MQCYRRGLRHRSFWALRYFEAGTSASNFSPRSPMPYTLHPVPVLKQRKVTIKPNTFPQSLLGVPLWVGLSRGIFPCAGRSGVPLYIRTTAPRPERIPCAYPSRASPRWQRQLAGRERLISRQQCLRAGKCSAPPQLRLAFWPVTFCG